MNCDPSRKHVKNGDCWHKHNSAKPDGEVSSDGVEDTSLKAKDSTLKAKAKTKDFKIVLEDPRGRGLVLEDSNTES